MQPAGLREELHPAERADGAHSHPYRREASPLRTTELWKVLLGCQYPSRPGRSTMLTCCFSASHRALRGIGGYTRGNGPTSAPSVSVTRGNSFHHGASTAADLDQLLPEDHSDEACATCASDEHRPSILRRGQFRVRERGVPVDGAIRDATSALATSRSIECTAQRAGRVFHRRLTVRDRSQSGTHDSFQSPGVELGHGSFWHGGPFCLQLQPGHAWHRHRSRHRHTPFADLTRGGLFGPPAMRRDHVAGGINIHAHRARLRSDPVAAPLPVGRSSARIFRDTDSTAHHDGGTDGAEQSGQLVFWLVAAGKCKLT